MVATHDTVCRLVVAAADGEPVTGFSRVVLENAGITTLVGPHCWAACTGERRGSSRRARVELGVQAL